MIINPILRRVGLANNLFVWARAELLRREFSARMFSPQWTHFMRLGPWLRKERDKRYYINLFRKDEYIGGFKKFLLNHTRPHISENKIRNTPPLCADLIIDVEGMEGFFTPIMKGQRYICERLNQIVNPRIVSKVSNIERKSFIGVHIRRTDFAITGQAIGNEWYIDAIEAALKRVGDMEYPIRIFSDSAAETLEDIVSRFPTAIIQQKETAIHDLLCLSRSRILVGTTGSTFGMWATYLGQMPSIWRDAEPMPELYCDRQTARENMILLQ